MLPPEIVERARAVFAACSDPDLKIATAESCTGGLVAAALTALAGSSRWVERGFVTYSNESKTDMLEVPADLIRHHGAVSEQVARAMAEGALARSGADISVAVTGIAGPTGGSEAKPVGTVHFAAARRDRPTIHALKRFAGDRDSVRRAATAHALDLLAARASENPRG